MRGLIFGNSHVGAVREAYDQSAGMKLNFYSLPGGGGPRIAVRDGKLHPATRDLRLFTDIEGAADGVLLDAFQFIVFCSFGFGAVREEYDHTILRNMSLARYARSLDEAVPVSDAVLKTSFSAFLLESGGARSLRLVREIFTGPIFVVPMPLPVVSRFTADDPLRRIYGDEVNRVTSWVAGCQMEALNNLTSTIEASAIEYPSQHWVEAGETPAEYICRQNDPWHMNGSYGRHVLQQVRERLSH